MSICSSKENSRIQGYQNCINPLSNVKQYIKWIADMRRYELDEEVVSSELRTLYKTIETFLGDNSKVRYKLKEKQLVVTLPNGISLPFDNLSDGYKNAIGIVADTAYRMLKLNPWLKENAVKETPGILLIDEIDLHLHPSWQKHILNDMKKTFPNMQITLQRVGLLKIYLMKSTIRPFPPSTFIDFFGTTT